MNLIEKDPLLIAFIGSSRDGFDSINGKKKKTKAYNVLEADPDFKNCNGWSLTVKKRDLRLLRDSNIGVFMVNLTKVCLQAFLIVAFAKSENLVT